MRIVIVGGSGLIGTRLVHTLRKRGHETIAASPSSGVNTFTGTGLNRVLAGSQVVVDVTNPPAVDGALVREFFETSTRNLLAAEAVTNVKHHVILSIVGSDRLLDSGYMRAKVAQEDLVRASTMPFTILRATQFFEFLGAIAGASTVQDTVRVPPAFVQPVAAVDVAEALADVAAGAPANNTLEFAGPQLFRLDELIQRYLRAIQDPRQVFTDAHVRYFGAQLEERSLIPKGNSRIGSTRFEHWLDGQGSLPLVNS